MDMLFHYLHLLATGVLIGKVVLLSFVVALASLIGLAYLEWDGFMIVLAIALWTGVLATEWYSRSSVTPRSNAMRDRLKEQELHGFVDPVLKETWDRLHQRSVSLKTAVLIAGLILVGAAGNLEP
jgi:hypothetical protein